MSPTPITPINTQPFAAVGSAVDLLTNGDGIVAVYGPNGTGKSYATATQLTRVSAKHVIADCPRAPTPQTLLVAILTAADPTFADKGTPVELLTHAAGALTDRTILVIDNAENLDKTCMKILRRLHLGPDATCPLLLVGEQRLAQKAMSQPWMRKPLLDLINVPPLEPEDVAVVIPNCHPFFHDCDLRALLHVNRIFAYGYWSRWRQVICVATASCNRSSIQRLDHDGAEFILSRVC